MADHEAAAIRRYPFLPRGCDIGWAPYLWLIWLTQVWVYPLVMPSAFQWWLAALSTAAFLPLYFLSYWLKGAKLMLVVAAICGIACVCVIWNQCGVMFFVYAGFLAGNRIEGRRALFCSLAIVATIAAESWLLHAPPTVWVPGIIFTGFASIMMAYRRQQRRMTKRLEMAHDEVERLAKIAERERIARDLHDLLGHTLSLIVLKSELASNLADANPARAAAEIRDVERISRDALAQVRSAVRGYRSSGLAAELEHVRETLQAAGIRFECTEAQLRVPPSQESVLVLALREAVTNVVRHARASSCRLTLRDAGSFCEFEVHDDGCGSASGEGCGLSGMRERVEALGGTLDRDGSAGMRLFIRLPVQNPAAGAA